MKQINGEKMYQVAELYRRMGKRYSTVESWCAAARLRIKEAGVQPFRVENMCFYRESDVRRVMQAAWDAAPKNKSEAMRKARAARSSRRTDPKPRILPVDAVQALRDDVKALRGELAELKVAVGAMLKLWVDEDEPVLPVEKPVTLAPLAPSEPPAPVPVGTNAVFIVNGTTSWTSVHPDPSALVAGVGEHLAPPGGEGK